MQSIVSLSSRCRLTSRAPIRRNAISLSPRAVKSETPEEALARRQRESDEYAKRVTLINNVAQLDKALEEAAGKLVVLEVQSEFLCESGMEGDSVQEREAKRDQWGNIVVDVRTDAMLKCKEIKHTFQRIARDSTDAVFLEVQVDADPSPKTVELLNHLEIDILPTLQFWKSGIKIYEHRGSQNMDQDMAEGVLYWDGSMADGQKAGNYVKELKSVKDVHEFAQSGAGDKILRVVSVSKVTSAPCLHLYPAVIALAKNFAGFASFARILVDDCAVTECKLDNEIAENTEAVMKDLGVLECPTFVMYSGGKEVGRFVGSSRVDLMSKILQVQASLGVAPPSQAGQGVKAPRAKMVRKV